MGLCQTAALRRRHLAEAFGAMAELLRFQDIMAFTRAAFFWRCAVPITITFYISTLGSVWGIFSATPAPLNS